MGTAKLSRLIALAAIAGVIPLFGSTNEAKATISTWTGNGGDNDLANNANWSDGTPTGDLAVFPSISSVATPSVMNGVSFLGMTIDNSGATWAIGGSSKTPTPVLTLGASGIAVSGAGTVNWQVASTLIKTNQNWSIDPGVTVATGSTSALTLTGKLTKTGLGTLLLQGASTGAGGIEVAQGTLAANQASTVAGSGLITVDNGATFEARNAVVGTNAIVLQNGATALGTGASAALSSAGISLSATGTTVSINSGPASTDVFTLNGVVAGGDITNLVTIGGAGTVVLAAGSSASDAYAGKWKIISGTLKVANIDGLGNRDGTVSLVKVFSPTGIELAGGTLAAAGTDANNTTMEFSDNILVSASSTILIDKNSGSGTSVSGVSKKFNALTIGPSTLTVGLSNLVTGPAGSSATEVGFSTGTLTGNATFNVTGTISTVGVNFTAAIGDNGSKYGITKTGGGFLNLAGVNTYTGGTTVAGGQLNFGNLSGISTSAINVQNNALVTFNNGGTSVTIWTLTGTALSGSGTISAQGTSSTLAMKGLAISPGGTGTVGTLTLQATGATKAISINSNGGTLSALNIDVIGTDNGDYDQLVLSAGSLLGNLHMTNLFISTGTTDPGAFAGMKLTIISAPGINLTGLSGSNGFANIYLNGVLAGNMAAVYYENGDIAVMVPEPTGMAGLGLLSLGILHRRRRRSS